VVATWSLPSLPGPLALTADVLLLTTIGVAVGGLVLLWLHGGKDTAVVRRYSGTAAVCAGLLAAVGGYLAVHNGLAARWPPAGLLALVALLVVTWALTRRWQRAYETSRAHGPGRFRQSVAAATGIAAL